jgi:hypothetical protein
MLGRAPAKEPGLTQPTGGAAVGRAKPFAKPDVGAVDVGLRAVRSAPTYTYALALPRKGGGKAS